MTEPVDLNVKSSSAVLTNPKYAAATDAQVSLSPAQTLGVMLHLLAAGLTLAAAIRMTLAKQTIFHDLYSFYGKKATIGLPVKVAHYSAYIYFTVPNAIMFTYSSLSILASIRRSPSCEFLLLLPVSDVMMVALLFSCNRAMIAIALIADKGDDRAGWDKSCDTNGTCGHVKLSILVSLIVI